MSVLGTTSEAADVVVLPYISATQSAVVQLAYAHGIPVIVSRVGGLPDVVRPEETGLLVPPNDPVALAAAIGRFFHDDLGPGCGPTLQPTRPVSVGSARSKLLNFWWRRPIEYSQGMRCGAELESPGRHAGLYRFPAPVEL